MKAWLPLPAVTVCLDELPRSVFKRLALPLLFPPSYPFRARVSRFRRLFFPVFFSFFLVSRPLLSESERGLCQNGNAAPFDAVAVCVQTPWHINEQRSPRKHDRATGFLSID